MDNELTSKIIGAAIEAHRALGGPGLLERVYETALLYELTWRGLRCQQQVAIPVKYKHVMTKETLYLDLLVEEKIIIEVKATSQDCPISAAQLLTYLRLTGLQLGLLLNFGKKQMKEGITRLINTPPCVDSARENSALFTLSVSSEADKP
jgi:GxxExxY protein